MREIRLYFFLRLLMLFSVLASLILFQRTGLLSHSVIYKTYATTFCTFLLTSIFLIFYESTKNSRYFLISQIAYDILFTTVLIFYTGPADSIYKAFYLFNIIFASILFSSRGALTVALASAVLYTFAVISTGLWSKQGGDSAPLFSLLTTFTAFVAIALLSGQFVDDIRRSRIKIKKLEEINEQVVESLDSAVLVVSGDGHVASLNHAAVSLLNAQKAEDLVDRKIETIAPFLAEAQHSEIKEVQIQSKLRKILVSLIELPEARKMFLLKDLTEVLDLQEKVRRQERLAGIGKMAAGVAHEIRNPIASISGSAQLLISHKESPEELDKLLKIILRESDRVDSLVSQLVRFAKPSSSDRVALPMLKIVEECIEAVCARTDFRHLNVNFKVSIPEDLTILSTEGQFREVTTNLITNSLQAFLELKQDRKKEIEIHSKRTGDQVELSFKDNGPGISKDNQTRVFDLFFSTKPYGTGLGLAQVHKIIREHGGTIDLETNEGEGTCLKIKLPA